MQPTELNRKILSGEWQAASVLRGLKADEDYFIGGLTKDDGAVAWRTMLATMGIRNMSDGEKAYAATAFGEDVEAAGYSAFELHEAVAVWRRSAERFMPTFGQMHAKAVEARAETGRQRLEMLRHAVTHDPEAEARKHEAERARQAKARADAERAQRDHDFAEHRRRTALLSKWRKERDSGELPDSQGELHPWHRMAESMFVSLRDRVKRDNKRFGEAS